jgi:predicted nucleic acid-binding protein
VVLVDSSVWIAHIRFAAEPVLVRLLGVKNVLGHPLVTGEVAMGSFKDRTALLDYLDGLKSPALASDKEVRRFIESERLYARGAGYIDAHLLVSARLTPGTSLWTRDKRLHEVAMELGLAFHEARPN